MTEARLHVIWLCLEWPREQQHVGGVGRYCMRLADEIKDDVELTVVAFEGAREVPGVAFSTLPAPRGRFSRFYGAPVEARRLVSSIEADLVHAHGDDWLISKSVPLVRSFYGSSW